MFARFLALKRDGGAAVKTTAPKKKVGEIRPFILL